MSYNGLIVARELIKYSKEEQSCPIKLYVFKSFTDTFGNNKELSPELVKRILNERFVINDFHSDDFLYPYLIAFTFGDKEKEKLVEGIDIFGFRARSSWDENPMYNGYTYENGVYIPKEDGMLCGAGIRILAEEEKLRLTFKEDELDKYLKTWPNIGELLAQDMSCALMSEASLAKDWLNPEEDKAWKDL